MADYIPDGLTTRELSDRLGIAQRALRRAFSQGHWRRCTLRMGWAYRGGQRVPVVDPASLPPDVAQLLEKELPAGDVLTAEELAERAGLRLAEARHALVSRRWKGRRLKVWEEERGGELVKVMDWASWS